MFTGLSAFPLTPTDEQGIDEAAFVGLVERLVTAGVDSIAPLGSTGNYAYFSRAERARVVQLAVEAAGSVPVLVSVGAVRTRDVLELASDAVAAGASAVLLAPVSYQPLTDDEVFGLYEDVTRELGVPLVVYDNPATTKFAFSAELFARVAALPNVAALKTSADKVGSLLDLGLTVGVAGDEFAASGLAAGASVWFSVLGGLFPELALRIMRGEAGDLEPLWVLFRHYGSLRVVAGMAAALGLTGPVNLPRPLRAVPREELGAALAVCS